MKKGEFPTFPVLLMDDDLDFLESCELFLQSSGIINLLKCSEREHLNSILKNQDIEVIVLDLLMPNVSGEDLLEQVLLAYPEIPVIILTGVNDIDIAVKCMKKGAYSYLVKPVEGIQFISEINRAIEIRELRKQNFSLKNHLLNTELDHPEFFSKFLTRSSSIQSVLKYAESISNSPWTLCITGETGVGKELLARAIHEASGRPGPFVPVNSGGLDDGLFSDTLFGHKRGAFTGADQTRPGLIEQAVEGTLFLDEIGDLTPSSQIKLLRLLQEKEYYPLGHDFAMVSNTRLIVATNQNLNRLVEEGKFRSDLNYRLKIHYVHIPPLREHMEDLPILLDKFLDEAAKSLQKKKPAIPKELFPLLYTYEFPGNTRELQNLVFDAVSRHKYGTLSLKTFKDYLASERKHIRKEPQNTSDINFYFDNKNGPFIGKMPTLKEAEKLLIKTALEKSGGNQTLAADLLGITRSSLNKKIHRSKLFEIS